MLVKVNHVDIRQKKNHFLQIKLSDASKMFAFAKKQNRITLKAKTTHKRFL